MLWTFFLRNHIHVMLCHVTFLKMLTLKYFFYLKTYWRLIKQTLYVVLEDGLILII